MPAGVAQEEFERGKRHACSYWLDRGEDDAAEAFLLMRLEACRFGFDQRSCMAWMHMPGIMIGLRFSAETGAYETSFFRRRKR